MSSLCYDTPEVRKDDTIQNRKMTDLNDDNILDENGRTINTRVYQFTRADGSKVLIQDHSTGHKFGRADGIGDQKAHFNLRPIEKPRNGNVPGAKEH